MKKNYTNDSTKTSLAILSVFLAEDQYDMKQKKKRKKNKGIYLIVAAVLFVIILITIFIFNMPSGIKSGSNNGKKNVLQASKKLDSTPNSIVQPTLTATPSPTASDVDKIPPSAPKLIQAKQSTADLTVDIVWQASTDNVGIKEYELYQDGQLIAITNATSYKVSGLTPSKSYVFSIKASDIADNLSLQSNTIKVIIKAMNTPTPVLTLKPSATPTTDDPSISFEAENCKLLGNAIISQNYVGYTGTGFVTGFNNTLNTGISYQINIIKSGIYKVSVRCSGSGNINSTLSVYVDNVLSGSLMYKTVGTGNPWTNIEGNLNFEVGKKTFELRSSKSTVDSINIDSISIVPAL